MLLASSASGLAAFLVAWVITTALGVVLFVVLRVRGNRIRALEEDPRIARAVVIVGAESARARTLMDEALRRLDMLSASFNEEAGELTFRTGMSWRSWSQETQVAIHPLSAGRCELRIASRAPDSQTIGALSAGRSLIAKFVKALKYVATDIPVDLRPLEAQAAS
jgi:hypothetical protein